MSQPRTQTATVVCPFCRRDYTTVFYGTNNVRRVYCLNCNNEFIHAADEGVTE